MNDNTKKELIQTSKDFVFYIPSVIIPAFLLFLAIPVYTRLLGASDYGILSLVNAFILLVVAVITNWITSSVLRFLPKYQKTNQTEIFSSTVARLSFSMPVILCLIITIALFSLRSRFSPLLFTSLLVSIVQVLFLAVLNSLVVFFRANRNAKSYSIYIVINSVLSTFLSFTLAYLHQGIFGIIIGATIPPILLLFFLYRQTKRQFGYDLTKFSKPINKEIVLYGLPLTLSALSVWILSSSDRFLIRYYMQDNQPVGIYAASYDIARSLILVITSFTLASSPSLVNMWENNREQTPIFLQNLTRLFIILTLPATILLCLVAQPLVALFTPPAFASGYKIIYFVAFGIFFYGLYQLAFSGLWIKQKTWIIAINILVTGLVSIILNSFFIPRYGLYGAAYSCVASYIYIFLSTVFLVRNHLPWRLPNLTNLTKIITCAILPAIPVYYLVKLQSRPMQIVAVIAIYTSLYIVLLLVTKTLYSGELTMVKSRITKKAA